MTAFPVPLGLPSPGENLPHLLLSQLILLDESDTVGNYVSGLER